MVIEAGLDSLAGGQLFFTVWDKGTFSKDDLIGETQVPIVQFVRFQDYQKAGGAGCGGQEDARSRSPRTPIPDRNTLLAVHDNSSPPVARPVVGLEGSGTAGAGAQAHL